MTRRKNGTYGDATMTGYAVYVDDFWNPIRMRVYCETEAWRQVFGSCLTAIRGDFDCSDVLNGTWNASDS